MSNINVLDSSVFSRIAAGEVVESPYSVVKELTENSIDAGATAVSIEIKNGGIDYIRIADNGHGIDKEDLKKAFLPHATSKISKSSDLDCIATLGFRGEALSSIASVATVSMTSRRADNDLGAKIQYDSGEFVSIDECGCSAGTSVTVEKLFEKIPARRKFLKKASAEEADISNLVSRLILANPSVSFKYSADGKKIFHSEGSGVENALKTVYGTQVLDGLQKISLDLPDIQISGYISKPSFSKHNRSFQTLIVNGRYVENEEISYTVFGRLREFLMTRRYPMYIFYITLPFDMVDVNVHPRKMEIKFVQTKRILSLIGQAIDTELFAIVSSTAEYESNSAKNDFVPIADNEFKTDTIKFAIEEAVSKTKTYTSELKPTNETPQLNLIKIQPRKATQRIAEKPFREIAATSFHKVIGKLFNTYILLEIGDSVYLIDQHAAHERILYNKLTRAALEGGVARQSMLIPFTFSVSHADKNALDDRLDALMDCGFDIRNSGGLQYSIYTVPMLAAGINLELFVACLLEKSIGDFSTLDLIKDGIIQSACKSAVKQGDDLTDGEIAALLAEMSSTDESYCPHGRPTVFKLDKTDLERLFKRII